MLAAHERARDGARERSQNPWPAALAAFLGLAPVVGGCERVVRDEPGGMLGVSLSFGTARTRLGVVARAYYAASNLQANAELAVHYNVRSLGPPASGPELRASLGGVVAWGARGSDENVFLTPVSNQTGRACSLAYAWNLYLDRLGTSQDTGTIALQFDRFSLTTENDLFAGHGEDRFRTGAVAAAYRDGSTTIAVRTVLWTGDTETGVPKIRDASYPSKFGYKDMRQAQYGNRSHGILSLKVQHAWRGFQTVGLEAGVDWERVRHVVQNRLIHDAALLPDRWVDAENAHVPMLDAEGAPFLFRDGQRVEPPEAFVEVGTNGALFY